LPAVQLSARVELHVVHALAPAPQFAAVVGDSQVLPLQQPEVHVCEQPVQTLFTQVLPRPHEPHALPLDPQAVSWLPGKHTLLWQQPPGQLVALHTQEPPTQASPVPQAAFVPHLQVPPEHVSVLAALHTLHDPPPVPQVEVAFALQTLPEQQPFAQEVASQTHAPPTHRCPLVHAAPPPQEQPPAVQPSAMVVLQLEQPLPLAPQEVTPGASQVVPLQQPDPHDVASQTQPPLTQCCPAAHTAPEPHAHLPEEEQESARIGSHATQAAPPAPQARAVGVEVQVLPLQQPPVHALAQSPQTPLLQSWPDAQAVHAEPAMPHAVASGLVSQWLLLSQHPLAHEVASHTHDPPTQCWPEPQGAPAPHAQLPPAHVSARTASQATQAEPVAPFTPHWPTEATWQAPLTQQPLGHDVESQTQPPPEHR
jgi:hypothetical protein